MWCKSGFIQQLHLLHQCTFAGVSSTQEKNLTKLSVMIKEFCPVWSYSNFWRVCFALLFQLLLNLTVFGCLLMSRLCTAHKVWSPQKISRDWFQQPKTEKREEYEGEMKVPPKIKSFQESKEIDQERRRKAARRRKRRRRTQEGLSTSRRCPEWFSCTWWIWVPNWGGSLKIVFDSFRLVRFSFLEDDFGFFCM